MLRWHDKANHFEVILLDIAKDNPAEARRIKKACSYEDVARAWVNNRRKTEGIGYRVE